MSIWIYSIAMSVPLPPPPWTDMHADRVCLPLASIVSLPKQLAVVWLGYEFGVNKHNSDPAKAKEQKIISLSVFFGTALATVLALYIVYMWVYFLSL